MQGSYDKIKGLPVTCVGSLINCNKSTLCCTEQMYFVSQQTQRGGFPKCCYRAVPSKGTSHGPKLLIVVFLPVEMNNCLRPHESVLQELGQLPFPPQWV